jgi:hypothetical protein
VGHKAADEVDVAAAEAERAGKWPRIPALCLMDGST